MSFIAMMNKSYATREEYTVRLARFLYADAHIKKVNAPNSGYTHTAAHNKFSDWTEEEFERLMTLDKKDAEEKSMKAVQHKMSGVKAAANVDWASGNCSTPVKDQGSCGS